MDIIKELKLSRTQLKDIIDKLKFALHSDKEIQKFLRYILRIENNEIIIHICENVKLIEVFNDKVDIDLLMIIKRNSKSFIEFLKIKQLQDIFIEDFDIVEDILKKYGIKHILYFYTESKKNIPNFELKFNDNLDLFYTCLLDKYFIKSFGVNNSSLTSIYINSNNILDNDTIDINPNNYFINNNQNKKFPNVIIDYNNDEGRDIALILDTYKEQVLEKIDNITMNRVYKIELNGKIYYIQITFNTNDKKYLIFIFEYFQDYEQLISHKPYIRDIYAEYIQLMETPIYVCIAYRDIELNNTNSDERIFVENNIYIFLFYKEYRYYGNFLTTSTIYRRQNILYLLFYIYGLILRNIELIYEKNSFGMELSEYFVLKLDNATDIPHKNCPYCKVGFKIAKKYLPNNNNVDITNSVNLNTFQNIISNRDIYYLNNQYTLANLNYQNSSLLSNIHSYYIHYLNPSLRQLDTFVRNKLELTNQSTIAYNIVLNSNFTENISQDLQNYQPKHLLNKDINAEFQNYTKKIKEHKIKEHYRKLKSKVRIINVD
jgi:hypothetical protein